ncbi:MAG: DnaB-like helicase C-terminal domain-containing protein [Marinifilaceae bacterium]
MVNREFQNNIPKEGENIEGTFFSQEKNGLRQISRKSRSIPISGIYTCIDFDKKILDNYKNGQPIGTTTHFPEIDEHWTWRLGEVSIITGFCNQGKSLLVGQLLLLKAIGDNWNHAIFCPEEMPSEDYFTNLIESYVGKSASKNQAKYNNYMTLNELNDAISNISPHFFLVNPPDNHSIDNLIRHFTYLVEEKKVQTITIDPYNQIHHNMEPGEREDLYISRFMTKLKKFAIEQNVAVLLIAHQNTPEIQRKEINPKPSLYRIKGGGTFADKADNVLAIWRPFINTNPLDTSIKFMSLKIKKQKLTGIPGKADLTYERKSNRFMDKNGSPIHRLKQKYKQT